MQSVAPSGPDRSDLPQRRPRHDTSHLSVTPSGHVYLGAIDLSALATSAPYNPLSERFWYDLPYTTGLNPDFRGNENDIGAPFDRGPLALLDWGGGLDRPVSFGIVVFASGSTFPAMCGSPYLGRNMQNSARLHRAPLARSCPARKSPAALLLSAMGSLLCVSACKLETYADAPPPAVHQAKGVEASGDPAGADDGRPDLVIPDVCPAVIQRIDEKTLWFCGPMVDDAPSRLLAALRETDDTLVVTSTGGRPIPAIQIGRIVLQRKLHLVVRGMCTSGCAHFVFMAAESVEVEDNAFVGFHRTNSLIYEVRLALRDSAADKLLPGSTAERALYQELGIDQNLLLAPGLQVEPVCVSPSVDGVSAHLIGSRYRMSVPTRDTVNRYRKVPFVGFWFADDVARAPRVVQLVSGSVFRVTYDQDVYALDSRGLAEEIKKVPFC